MDWDTVNVTRLVVVFVLFFGISLWYYTKQNARASGKALTLRELGDVFMIAVVMGLLATFVTFVLLDYLPHNSSPSACELDGDVCTPYKG